jgi:hypothetical protein
MRRAAQFITLATVVHVLGFFIALPGHLSDPTWSAHAQFHHVLGFVWLTGFSIMILALTWGPLQRNDRWTFWLLLVAFIFAQGGFFVTSLLEPAGRPMEAWQNALLGLVVLIFAVGLITAWRALPKSAIPS